jgi:hypothetical protein
MKRPLLLAALALAAVGCNQNKPYTRTVTLKQSAFLTAPAVDVDLSGIPADWVLTRTTKEYWGDMDEVIEFDNAQSRRVKIVVVPVTPTTQP